VTEKAKETNQQEEISDVSPTRSLGRFVGVLRLLRRPVANRVLAETILPNTLANATQAHERISGIDDSAVHHTRKP
jgi:hypothetical protein